MKINRPPKPINLVRKLSFKIARIKSTMFCNRHYFFSLAFAVYFLFNFKYGSINHTFTCQLTKIHCIAIYLLVLWTQERNIINVIYKHEIITVLKLYQLSSATNIKYSHVFHIESHVTQRKYISNSDIRNYWKNKM